MSSNLTFAGAAQPLAQVDAVAVGQAEVEQDHVRRGRGQGRGQGRGPGRGMVGGEAVAAEPFAQRLGDPLVVLDDQYPHLTSLSLPNHGRRGSGVQFGGDRAPPVQARVPAKSLAWLQGGHGEGCGHVAVPHGDHVDYVHDGHRHAGRDDHYDEH
nr:hypothetical protein [Amycolatopsis vastitatis]